MSQIKEEILRELNDLPPGTCHEVLGFIRFLKSRSRQNILETVTASEVIPMKDWLLPEEDEAWSGL